MRQKSQLEAAASVIDADIIGSTECRARGITVRGGSPALALCRALIGAGYDPSRPLHVYRGATLALIIHTIGEGAKLTVAEGGHRPRFRRLEPQDWAKVRGTSGQGEVLSPPLGPDLPDDHGAAGEANGHVGVGAKLGSKVTQTKSEN